MYKMDSSFLRGLTEVFGLFTHIRLPYPPDPTVQHMRLGADLGKPVTCDWLKNPSQSSHQRQGSGTEA